MPPREKEAATVQESADTGGLRWHSPCDLRTNARQPSRTCARVPRHGMVFLSGDSAATIRAVPDGNKDRLSATVASVHRSRLHRIVATDHGIAWCRLRSLRHPIEMYGGARARHPSPKLGNGSGSPWRSPPGFMPGREPRAAGQGMSMDWRCSEYGLNIPQYVT